MGDTADGGTGVEQPANGAGMVRLDTGGGKPGRIARADPLPATA
ncbi:hypothetical protein [Phytohabitans suffuscus]|nr:hypothetical protein [Phytohabitans suffuscus]